MKFNFGSPNYAHVMMNVLPNFSQAKTSTFVPPTLEGVVFLGGHCSSPVLVCMSRLLTAYKCPVFIEICITADMKYHMRDGKLLPAYRLIHNGHARRLFSR